MSIAEMIMGGTEQQSKNWSVLSENLGRLGQQVGNQLALREYQKQAATALPAMQAAYRSAMDDVAKGQTAAGYRKFMDAQFQFGTSQNPFIAQANTQAGSIFENAITVREKQLQRQAQYGGGVGGPSGLDRLRGGGTIVEPASLPVLSAQETSPEQAIASYEDQTRYGAPTLDMEEEPYDTDLREAQIAEQIQTNPDLTQEQKQFAPQVLQFQKLDPAQKAEELNQSTTETVDTGFERVKVAGLEKIYPNLTGELGIPQVGTITKIKQTTSTSDAPGSKINYSFTPVETKVGESLYNHNIETYKTMGKAVNKMLNQAPIDSKEKFVNLFEKNGGIENAVVSPTTDPEVFNLFFNGNEKDQYEITSKQAEDIGIVQSIPATGGSGIRFVGTPKTAAPAPAAGGEKKERFPEKKTEAPSSPQVAAPVAAPAAPAKEMTLEERISAKTSAPTSTRTATPEQLAGVKAGQVRQQKSSLESEATKLERALYDMPRTAGGKKQLKRGLSAQDPDVKSALQRIAEIKKQLEAL